MNYINVSLIYFKLINFYFLRAKVIECCCFFVKENNIETEIVTWPELFSTNQTVDILYVTNNIYFCHVLFGLT